MRAQIVPFAEDPDAQQAIIAGLAEYNRQQVGRRDLQPLNLAVRNSEGEVIGGLLGCTIWDWLLIDRLWVAESARHCGWGKALLQQAEAEAEARHCQYAALDTFSFQALPFYTRLGYEVYGQLDGFPAGQSRYSLRKRLRHAPPRQDAVGRATEAMRVLGQIEQEPEAAYLKLLYQTALDMLDRQPLAQLLDVIIGKAAELLDSPMVELMLLDGDELEVVACTANLGLKGERVRRGESLVSWRALDSGSPVLIDNYSQWLGQRAVYNHHQLSAIADIPISIGHQPLGVLALARQKPDQPYLPQEVELALRFAKLAALVINNAHHETQIQQELLERRATEARLRMQNQELDAYARTVAHDLKTPLTSLIGMSRMLQQSEHPLSDAARRQALDLVYRNALKMNQIIEALLSLSQHRLSDPVRLQAISPELIAQEASQRLSGLIAQYATQLEIKERLPKVLAHNHWLEEVFANLISNAIKYGGKPARIEVGGALLGQQVRLWVRDHGPGIPPAALGQLFREFTRLDSDAAEGHGLGLSIVKRLVEAMGGEVGVENMPDGGARFYLLLTAA